MNLRFILRIFAHQKIEIATAIRLQHMPLMQGTETTLKTRLGARPGRPALRQFLVRDFDVQLARRHVEFDQIAVANKCERSADEGFRRDMQHTGAIARAAMSL